MPSLLVLVPVALGMLIAWQGPINAELSRYVAGPVAATLFSLIFSILVILAIAVVTRLPLGLAGWTGAPWWALVGGTAGTAFVLGAIYIVPMTGVAVFIVAAVLGQAIGASLADHFGWFGLQIRPINLSRLGGIALLVVGLWLVRRT